MEEPQRLRHVLWSEFLSRLSQNLLPATIYTKGATTATCGLLLVRHMHNFTNFHATFPRQGLEISGDYCEFEPGPQLLQEQRLHENIPKRSRRQCPQKLQEEMIGQGRPP